MKPVLFGFLKFIPSYQQADKVKKIVSFYYQGFKNMSKDSKKLWIIVLIKLFIMFAVLKVFFFPDFLNSKYSSEEQKSEHVIEQLINH